MGMGEKRVGCFGVHICFGGECVLSIFFVEKNPTRCDDSTIFFGGQKSLGFIFVVVGFRNIISTCCMCVMYVFMKFANTKKSSCNPPWCHSFQLQVPLPATLRIFPLLIGVLRGGGDSPNHS